MLSSRPTFIARALTAVTLCALAAPASAQFSGYAWRADADAVVSYKDDNFESHMVFDEMPNGGIGYHESSASVGHYRGSGSGSASLATGQLHAFASSNGGKAEAGATLAETLLFTSSLTEPAIVPFHFLVDGVLSESHASATFEYWVTGMYFSGVMTLQSGDNEAFFGVVIPPGQTQAIKVFTQLGVSVLPSIGMYADFSHTAHIKLAVPDGITYTSASGLFLTAPTPEPTLVLPSLAAAALSTPRRPRQSPRH